MMRAWRSVVAAVTAAWVAGVLLGCQPLTGTETGNGTSGMVMGCAGKPVAGAQVMLVPVDYSELEPTAESKPFWLPATSLPVE